MAAVSHSTPRPTRSGRGHEPDTITLASSTLHRLTSAETLDHILDALDRDEGGWVITYNLDILRKDHLDPDFASRASASTLRVADGMPLLWSARLQGTPLPERVAGSDLVYSLTSACAARGRSVFFLGGHPADVCDRAASQLQARDPELIVAGTYSPPLAFMDVPEEVSHIRKLLTEADPDVVLIGLPPMLQSAVHTSFSDAPPTATWWVGLGVSFSFVTGDVKRAPTWMQRMGLEWVHRLIQEPRRLGRRYLVEGLPFAARLFVGAAWKRLRTASDGQ